MLLGGKPVSQRCRACAYPKTPRIKQLWELGGVQIKNGHACKLITCPQCGRQRWVRLRHIIRDSFAGLCWLCNNKKYCKENNRGKKSRLWKGSRHRDKNGYILVRLYPEDFFFPMAGYGGRIREHRLIMAKHLGRCLHPWEIVHHKNGVKDDNRLENLQLVTDDRHRQITLLENRIKFLEDRVVLLEGENELLKARQGVSV